MTPVCVDNYGGADARLPNLISLTEVADRDTPWILGMAKAQYRSQASVAIAASGFAEPTSLIDPTAVVASTVEVGHGAYVNSLAVVASNSRLGCHSHVNRSVSVGHDCKIGFAASVCAGAVLAGFVDDWRRRIRRCWSHHPAPAEHWCWIHHWCGICRDQRCPSG
ncbi:MAG: hypothetical protein V9G13_01130 [Marmoricola sp.]